MEWGKKPPQLNVPFSAAVTTTFNPNCSRGQQLSRVMRVGVPWKSGARATTGTLQNQKKDTDTTAAAAAVAAARTKTPNRTVRDRRRRRRTEQRHGPRT